MWLQKMLEKTKEEARTIIKQDSLETPGKESNEPSHAVNKSTSGYLSRLHAPLSDGRLRMSMFAQPPFGPHLKCSKVSMVLSH